MVLEWLRRNDPTFDRHLRTYLFTDGRDVLQVEEEAEHGGGEGTDATPLDLGIGSLHDETEGTL